MRWSVEWNEEVADTKPCWMIHRFRHCSQSFKNRKDAVDFYNELHDCEGVRDMVICDKAK